MTGTQHSTVGRLALSAALLMLVATGCSLPEERVFDNQDSSFAIVSGDWSTGHDTNGNGCYGLDFRYCEANPYDIGRARFALNLEAPDDYYVSIYWSAADNRTECQPVVVHLADGSDSVRYVNLREHGNEWFSLGDFSLGPNSYVEFNTDTDYDGYCIADAVKLMRF